MKIFKAFLVTMAAIFVLATVTYLWIARDTNATHSTLAKADLPDLIPVSEFWADTSGSWAYKPSSDGEHLAWRMISGTEEVVVLGRADRSEITRLSEVDDYYFDDASQHFLIVRKQRLWRVDPAKPSEDQWLDVTPRGFNGWSISNRPTDASKSWLIASSDRNPAFADLYRTKQDGSDKEIIFENEGKTLGWIIGDELEAQMRIDKVSEGTLAYFVANGKDWRQLLTISINKTFAIHEVSKDLTHAFATSTRGRDKAALVRVDLVTGAEDVIVEEADEDLFDIINFSQYDGEIDAVLTKVGDSDVIGLSARGKKLAELLGALPGRTEVESLAWSGNARFVTATVSPDALSYEYYWFDLEAGVSTKLSTYSFRQNYVDRLVNTEEVQIPARDGLKLHGLLLRPKGVNGPVPTVVMVHGGPALQDFWGYDHFRQFLVNRGYAVLAVNFRGSTGFGESFQAAGFGEIGRKMQDDVADAAKWAIDQGIADADALAVQGGSYGGYASAMAMVRDTGLFKVGIVEHAVLDLPYQMNNNPHAWGLTPELMARYLGDPKVPTQLEDMRARSPVSLVKNLQAPILLVAGKRDGIVGFEQTEKFASAAKELNKDVETLIFEDEGHGLYQWQSKVAHARRVEDFLSKHLGGRSGGFDWIELPAKWLK
jgi:dipeptidyl aminopeptidase/acylaminoacyl peptidase